MCASLSEVAKNAQKSGQDFILLTKRARGDWGHYVLLDHNGNLYDPEDGIIHFKDYERKLVAFSICLLPIAPKPIHSKKRI